MKYQLFETVVLTRDLNADSLKRGDEGVVVEVYDDGAGYEVEFVDQKGNLKAVKTLSPDDIGRQVTVTGWSLDTASKEADFVTSIDSRLVTIPSIKSINTTTEEVYSQNYR